MVVESKYSIYIGMYDTLLSRAAYFKRNLCTVTLEEVYCFTEFCSFVVFLISEDYHDRSLRIQATVRSFCYVDQNLGRENT